MSGIFFAQFRRRLIRNDRDEQALAIRENATSRVLCRAARHQVRDNYLRLAARFRSPFL